MATHESIEEKGLNALGTLLFSPQFLERLDAYRQERDEQIAALRAKGTLSEAEIATLQKKLLEKHQLASAITQEELSDSSSIKKP